MQDQESLSKDFDILLLRLCLEDETTSGPEVLDVLDRYKDHIKQLMRGQA